MLTLIVIGLAVAAVAPWRRLETYLARRAYGIDRRDLKRGVVVLARNRRGTLVPRPGPATRAVITEAQRLTEEAGR